MEKGYLSFQKRKTHTWSPKMLSLTFENRSPDMAAMHQDTSEDHEVVDEKLKEIFGVRFSCISLVSLIYWLLFGIVFVYFIFHVLFSFISFLVWGDEIVLHNSKTSFCCFLRSRLFWKQFSTTVRKTSFLFFRNMKTETVMM